MTELLEEILRTGAVRNADGTALPLHSNTSPSQCDFLQGLVNRVDARACLEIGLAYGISSLAICEAIAKKPGASLVSIDPYQTKSWRNIGLLNLERAGFSSVVEFHERASYEVLADLLRDGRRLDFAYVDTGKIFDVVMVDAFYLIKLLRVGGVVAFDDCAWPGIRKLVRYLTSFPHLEVFATHGTYRETVRRRVGSAIGRAIPFRERVLRPELISSDEALGINASCVALKKISEDERSWDWSIHP